MDNKQYTAELAKNINKKLKEKQAVLKFDDTPTKGSVNPVTSEGIKDYVDNHSGITYTAGENITITNNQINATDTTYTAGEGIDIDNNVISFKGVNVLEKYTSNGTEKSVSEINSFEPDYVGTDGYNTYYSLGDQQYIFDEDSLTGLPKNGGTYKPNYGQYVGSDGENIYYTGGSTNLVLNKETNEGKSETGGDSGNNLYGDKIGTDGENIYYSDYSTQKVLDKSTGTGIDKDGGTIVPDHKRYIGTDGNNMYYSYGSSTYQYILNKYTGVWEHKSGYGLDGLSGEQIGTDGNNIYYSYDSYQYILNKNNSTGMSMTGTGINDSNGNLNKSDIGKTKNSIYYYNDNYTPAKQYILDRNIQVTKLISKVAETGDYNDLKNLPSKYIAGKGIKINPITDNINIESINVIPYESGKNITIKDNVISNGILLPTVKTTFPSKEWVENSGILPSDLSGISYRGIWTFNNNIYYTESSDKTYILDKSTKTWVLTNIMFANYHLGGDGGFGTDGDSLYYNFFDGQGHTYSEVFNSKTNRWQSVTFKDSSNSIMYFAGMDVGTDGENIYYDGYVTYSGSSASVKHLVLNKEERKWTTNSGSGISSDLLSRFHGHYIGTDGENIYATKTGGNYDFNFVLNKGTKEGTYKSWNAPILNPGEGMEGDDIGTDGNNIYYSSKKTSKNCNGLGNKETNAGIDLKLNLALDGRNIITDGEEIYHLYSTDGKYLIKNKKYLNSFPKLDLYLKEKPIAGTGIKVNGNVVSIDSSTVALKTDITVPQAPTVAGTYTLQVVVDSEGNPTYSWVINS